jgi:hypothetical protein
MPGDVSQNMPAAELDDDEREEFEIWRRSREAIARCVADVEGHPEDEHYALADDVLLALMTADLMIVKRMNAP